MNKTSSTNKFYLFIGIIAIVAIFVIFSFIKNIFTLKLISLLFFAGCLYGLFFYIKNNDIFIENDTIKLVSIFNIKKHNLKDCDVYTIGIVRGPLFVMKTSLGIFKVAYTRKNYNVIIEILEKGNKHRIKKDDFIKKVRMYFFSLSIICDWAVR